MIHEELVDLIAEAIYCGLRDAKKLINIKDYIELSSNEKEFYLGIAHNITTIFDDYYDAELDDDDLYDDDENFDTISRYDSRYDSEEW